MSNRSTQRGSAVALERVDQALHAVVARVDRNLSSRPAKREPAPVRSDSTVHAAVAQKTPQDAHNASTRHAQPVSAAARVDPQVHAALARATGSMSPTSALLPLLDWALHLAISPGKQIDLAGLAFKQGGELGRYLRECMTLGPDAAVRACVEPPARDRRFREDEWSAFPFNALHQSFLLAEKWWEHATRGVWGVSAQHEEVVAFGARQALGRFSPGNYFATNPMVLARTFQEGGANLSRGALNALGDIERLLWNRPPAGAENFLVGRDVGITPGKVVYRNELIELIQYQPTTSRVKAEPILIVPAWIMKYYILDLSPHNSLIGHLVDEGYTVFCVSWKNPGDAERDLGMDDYLKLGFDAALDAVSAIVPDRKVHATGYCLGGTLLSIAAARMARDCDDRLASLTLLAAMADFSEPGELGLFIDDSAVSLLEAQMLHTGYLTGDQMSAAFQMLRSYDLVWSRMVRDYLLGEPFELNDLMAWNADATRLPARMHSEYLRHLYLDNDLALGRYEVDSRPVVMNAIKQPIFAVGTVTDHVAPWTSVYKIHSLTDAEVTFALTTGGHNAGIVSPPDHPRRRYQVLERAAGAPMLTTDAWQETASRNKGSWWVQWFEWLAARSSGEVAAPSMGAEAHGYPVLEDAPGQYVLEK